MHSESSGSLRNRLSRAEVREPSKGGRRRRGASPGPDATHPSGPRPDRACTRPLRSPIGRPGHRHPSNGAPSRWHPLPQRGTGRSAVRALRSRQWADVPATERRPVQSGCAFARHALRSPSIDGRCRATRVRRRVAGADGLERPIAGNEVAWHAGTFLGEARHHRVPVEVPVRRRGSGRTAVDASRHSIYLSC